MAASNQLNFLPEDYLERRRQQRTVILCLSLFAVVMIGLIVAFMLDERRQAVASDERDVVDRQMAARAQQIAQTEELEKRKEKMIHKADVTAALLERRQRSYILAYLTNSLPKDSSLLTMTLETKEIRKKESSEDSKTASKSRVSRVARKDEAKKKETVTRVETVRLIGLAPNDKVVSSYIQALDDSPLFRRVDLESSEEHVYQEQKVRLFILRAEMNDQAVVTDEMIQSQRVRPGAFD